MALQEAELGMTEMAFQQEHGITDEGDKNLFVRFFRKPRQDSAKSLEEGRPIFKELDYIEIMQPGNKENIISRPVSARDKQRFQAVWARYSADPQGDQVIGTPLSEWTALNMAQREELKHFNVMTVEQLANITDTNLQGFMGGQQLKQKAQAFLEVCGKAAEGEALADALAKQETENAILHETNQDLAKQIKALTTRLGKLEE